MVSGFAKFARAESQFQAEATATGDGLKGVQSKIALALGLPGPLGFLALRGAGDQELPERYFEWSMTPPPESPEPLFT